MLKFQFLKANSREKMSKTFFKETDKSNEINRDFYR